MATTTGGTTYVTSADLVADYPTASLALANRVDVVASGGPGLVKTSGYTITVADILGGNKFLYNSASPGTFTLPTSSLVDGMVVNVAQIGAGALTVSGGTIVGTTVTTAQYQGLSFVYVASGTTWYSIAPVASSGLVPISTQTLTASSGVIFNNVFTSTYDNYMIIYSITGSTTSDLCARMRTGGTDQSGSIYYNQFIQGGSSTVSGGRSTDTFLNIGTPRTNALGGSVLMVYPQATQRTTIQISHTDYSAGSVNSPLALVRGGVLDNAVSYESINIFPSTGTITGRISIFGVKQ
jgi:hypothetical protein